MAPVQLALVTQVSSSEGAELNLSNKGSKSHSLSLRRLVRNDNTIFVVRGEKIPLLSEQPIKSLGRQYTAVLSDKQMGRTVMKQLTDGLAKINQTQLPGKYKVWCYQFTLYRMVMWPLKMSGHSPGRKSRARMGRNATVLVQG